MAILKYYDDPDQLFNKYLIQARESEKKKMLRIDSQDGRKMIEGDLRSSVKSLKGGSVGKSVTALMPFVQNEQNARAINDLEALKQKKKAKEEEMKATLAKSMAKQNEKDMKLQEALQKRRVLMGVSSNVKGVKQELTAVVYKETPGNQMRNIL